MIAYAGYINRKNKKKQIRKTAPKPNYRIDAIQ